MLGEDLFADLLLGGGDSDLSPGGKKEAAVAVPGERAFLREKRAFQRGGTDWSLSS